MSKRRKTATEYVDALPEDGTRRLMLAVLVDAIRILGRRAPGVAYATGDIMWQRDRAWVMAKNRSQPFSFVSICEALGLEATHVRRRVLNPPAAQHPMPIRRYAGKSEETWMRLSRERRGELRAS